MNAAAACNHCLDEVALGALLRNWKQAWAGEAQATGIIVYTVALPPIPAHTAKPLFIHPLLVHLTSFRLLSINAEITHMFAGVFFKARKLNTSPVQKARAGNLQIKQIMLFISQPFADFHLWVLTGTVLETILLVYAALGEDVFITSCSPSENSISLYDM